MAAVTASLAVLAVLAAPMSASTGSAASSNEICQQSNSTTHFDMWVLGDHVTYLGCLPD